MSSESNDWREKAKIDSEFARLVTACPWLGDDWAAIGEKYKEWEACKDMEKRKAITDELLTLLEKYSKTVCEERENNIDWYHRVALNRATLKQAHKIAERIQVKQMFVNMLEKLIESAD